MKEMCEKIMKEGRVFPGDVLKVDSFLNHQIDPVIMRQIGEELYRLFGKEKITKILTVEASGIAMALSTAARFGVPMLFAKKSRSINLSPDTYTANVFSYTHNRTYQIMVSKQYLTAEDRILIVDDFLANGNALIGLIDLVKQAGGTVVGAGIGVEKGFQEGGKKLRAQGLRIESMAIVESMDDNSLVLRSE